MYLLKNKNGLYLMKVGLDNAFTNNAEIALTLNDSDQKQFYIYSKRFNVTKQFI